MGKAKKLRTTSHKKRVPPTGGPTQAEIEQAQQEDYNNFGKDEAAMFKGVSRLYNVSLSNHLPEST
jgi:hypothetical protein